MKMNQLDKWNKEIEALSNRRYRNMDSEIYNFYKDSLKQMKIEIKDYLERYEELSFSKRLELENQFKRAGRIDEILSDLSGKTTQSVTGYVRDELQLGYNGVWYAIESAENIQLDFGMLPERYINELVTKKVDGKNFSTRLYQYRKELADRTTTALLSAAANGEGYRKVAKQIGELTEANYKQALRIARTEGGRVQSTAKQKAYEEAEAIGVELEKQWMSTLDKKTRSSHQSLDGQTVGVDDDFVSENGHKAKGPRLFNVASEDINCRCTTITKVKGISPATRKDNESKEIIKYTNYKEWAEAKGYIVKDKKTLETNKFDANAILSKTNLREKVGDKNYNRFVEHMNKIENERVRGLFEKYADEISIEQFSAGNAKSVKAHARRSKITLRQDSFDGTAISNEFKTVYHEFGHAFDSLGLEKVTGKTRIPTGETQKRTILRKRKTVDVYATHLSGDPSYKLKENIQRDLWEYANGKGTPMLKDLGVKPRKKAERAIWDEKYAKTYRNGVDNFKKFEEKILEKYGSGNSTVAALSDIYGGTEFTQDAYPFGSGHSKSYWKDGGKLETEFFAHMTESVASPEGHELMKEIFPNASKSWEKMVDDMLEAD